MEICHKMVMTEAIFEEWKKHESKFARTWRMGMIARRKLIHLAGVSDADIKGEIDDLAMPRKDRAAMKKDALLIAAALATDDIVASMDDTARDLFRQACKNIARLGPVIWVNPANDYEAVTQWMRRGAKNSRALRLKNLTRAPDTGC